MLSLLNGVDRPSGCGVDVEKFEHEYIIKVNTVPMSFTSSKRRKKEISRFDSLN
jgi:hypothetical protein